MSLIIGMAGKGGTGKTTTAGLAAQYLAHTGRKPVLAVDADANANLGDVLIELRTQQAIVEGDDIDLIVMGKPEGAGCYCAANSILGAVLEKALKNYPYQVIDNEAGMEHISRLTSRYMDVFFVVSDASRRGLTAAVRIWHLVDELKITVRHKYLILNRVRGDVPQEVMDIITAEKMDLAGVIPDDLAIYEADQKARPTSLLTGSDSPAVAAAHEIFKKTLVEE